MSWPNKVIPDFTDAELVAAIKEHEHNPDPVIESIVRGCWREWERRHGLTPDVE
ncbi:hypothetical protein PUR71_14885 [Streptomyces sp. SP17BM10]|uniref:hypothetical protein n=1 Tax=Streptomyces sp. SP17BM10 TaxID=3002530 RepID=UPI002E794AF2|nr:hypothetical protein [Streptomyces sp. SP17BM10]MEE1784173.1 hypothetical protein [Streptomyces sp. SP17BM10]